MQTKISGVYIIFYEKMIVRRRQMIVVYFVSIKIERIKYASSKENLSSRQTN